MQILQRWQYKPGKKINWKHYCKENSCNPIKDCDRLLEKKVSGMHHIFEESLDYIPFFQMDPEHEMLCLAIHCIPAPHTVAVKCLEAHSVALA